MRKWVTIEIGVELSGRLVHDPDTGPDGVDDVEIDTAHMFGRDWSEIELRAEFGALATWIAVTDNGEEWE